MRLPGERGMHRRLSWLPETIWCKSYGAVLAGGSHASHLHSVSHFRVRMHIEDTSDQLQLLWQEFCIAQYAETLELTTIFFVIALTIWKIICDCMYCIYEHNRLHFRWLSNLMKTCWVWAVLQMCCSVVFQVCNMNGHATVDSQLPSCMWVQDRSKGSRCEVRCEEVWMFQQWGMWKTKCNLNPKRINEESKKKGFKFPWTASSSRFQKSGN